MSLARIAVLAAACALLPTCAVDAPRAPAADPLQIIPRPVHAEPSSGTFNLLPSTRIAVPDADEVRMVGVWLADLLAETAIVGVGVVDAANAPDTGVIRLEIADRPRLSGREAYRLRVTPDAITVTANDVTGVFYGAVTAWQLATAGELVEGAIRIPAVVIDDAPRFPWRGLMIDSARHYVPPPFMKNMIEWMALHKLNVLHWHLTDDQGWRLEIPGYPRLTEVGAWRVPAGQAAARDIDPATGKARRYGGYYTADEIRDIVAYAAKRQVTIVPEIDMPGHAQAAVAAYPELGVGEPPAGVSADWGVHDYLFNVNESTFATLEDILDVVVELFPGRYIHVGGDEAVKTRWESSEQVQARMRELGIATGAELQSWFIARIERHLAGHGRKLIGWDEILEGGIAPEATVMSWRGVEGALEAASLGHDAVLTPSPTLYFDHVQGRLPDEPPGRGGVISLADVYAFDPLPEGLDDAERRHVLGVQANLWSEHIRTPARLAYMAFPRAAALAEVAWSPADSLDWSGFVHRLPAQFERYTALGVPFATSAFDVRIAADRDPSGDGIAVVLSNQSGLGTIRYSADGSALTASSPAYTAPLRLSPDAELAAATFLDGRRLSAPAGGRVGLAARTRWSRQLELCSERLVLSLEDDAPVQAERRSVFLVDIMNPCWTWRDVDLSGIARIDIAVGQVPFNFQLGADRDKIVLAPPRTAAGELEVRADGCDADPVAILPLKDAAREHGITVLTWELRERMERRTDLCFRFTAGELDPMWVIDRVELRHATGDARQAGP